MHTFFFKWSGGKPRYGSEAWPSPNKVYLLKPPLLGRNPFVVQLISETFYTRLFERVYFREF